MSTRPGTGNPDYDQTNILFAATGVRLMLYTSTHHLVVFGTSTLLAASIPCLEIASYSHRESHVYLPSGGFWPERARWIPAHFRTTNGERKSNIATVSIDVVKAGIRARTIDNP